MKPASHLRLVPVLIAALALCPATRAEDVQLCKNHYILSEPCRLPVPVLEWVRLPDSVLPHDRTHTAVLLDDGRVLVVGGAKRGAYDPVTGTWPFVEPFGAETYDPSSREWRATAPMTRYRGYDYRTVRLLDGRVLVVDSTQYVAAIAEVFDPASDTWASTGTFNIARGGFSMTLLPDGKVLAAGGSDRREAILGSAEIWDPETGAWTQTGGLSVPRAWHTATALPDGRILVVGGAIDDLLFWSTGSAELFDPGTETWSGAGSIEARSSGHSATLTAGGEVLVAGGYDDRILYPGFRDWFVPSTVVSASIYSPAEGSWRNAGNLNAARFGHMAVPLSDFGVLVFGGDTIVSPVPHFGTAPQERTELFTRGFDAWSYIDAVNAPAEAAARYHSATPLADGTVLFIGEDRRAALLKYRRF